VVREASASPFREIGDPMFKRPRGILPILAVALVCCAVWVGVAVASSGSNKADGLGSSYDVSKAGNVTLTMWWLGDQEVPGIQAWMKKIIAAYHKLHPNVTVKSVVQSVGTWTQTQHIACKGKSGPDLWYNWSGTWSLEQAWSGCTVPNEAVLSASDISHNTNAAETKWQGKSWDYPLYRFVYPIVFNKALFTKAGLDPNKPPTTWAAFIAACKKLKAAGVQPIVLGLKDGFGGEIVGSATFQKQIFSNYNDLIKQTVDGNFSGAKWRSWITHAAQLKPYVNNDVNSLNFGDGLTRFQAGKAAMAFGTPGVQGTIISMVKDGKSVGVMKPPVFASSAYADSLVNTGNGFQTTSWSKNPKVAGNFMAFMHTPENLTSLYAMTGNFPSDTRWTATGVKSATDKQMLAWLKAKNVNYPANYYPTDLDVNGNFVVMQGLLGGKMTVDQAVGTYASVIKKWTKLHASEIQNYKIWTGAG
jgi:ABC-type glycerol-3-phosphate transport system substrate-binding protein